MPPRAAGRRGRPGSRRPRRGSFRSPARLLVVLPWPSPPTREPHGGAEHHGVRCVVARPADPMRRRGCGLRREHLLARSSQNWGNTPWEQGAARPTVSDMASLALNPLSHIASNRRRTRVVVCGVDGSTSRWRRCAPRAGSRARSTFAWWWHTSLRPCRWRRSRGRRRPRRSSPRTLPRARRFSKRSAQRRGGGRRLPDRHRAAGRAPGRAGRRGERRADRGRIARPPPPRTALIGGVSSELIGLATCPVLVIPAQALSWGAGERPFWVMSA